MQAHRSKRFAPGILAAVALVACGAAWTPGFEARAQTLNISPSVGGTKAGVIGTPPSPVTDVYIQPSYNNGSSDSASKAHGGCTIPSQRDASCLGWSGVDGTKNTDNSTLSTDPRGANARRVPGLTMQSPSIPNSCVSMPTTLWTWLGNAASFITPAASGYLGSGGSTDPTAPCSSPTDGSCSTWVPATHKFLFVGGTSFVECGGSPTSGSVSCPVRGANALVTTNPSAGANFQPYIIACRTGTADANVKVNDAPFAWWSNCTAAGSACSYVTYDPNPSSGGLP